MKKGISLIALIITIIVLIVLTILCMTTEGETEIRYIPMYFYFPR